jgi:hypothetical protein
VIRSPEAQVRRALAGQTSARLPDVYGFRAGGTAVLSEVAFADVSVAVEGGRARVVAVVEAGGEVVWREERTRLAYVGREQFEMQACTVALWCADGRQFERLRGVLAVLFRRADALAARDADAYARLVSERYAGPGGKPALAARLAAELSRPGGRVRPRAWQIRVERDTASVGEDARVEPDGAPARAERARFELALEDAHWRIVSGL